MLEDHGLPFRGEEELSPESSMHVVIHHILSSSLLHLAQHGCGGVCLHLSQKGQLRIHIFAFHSPLGKPQQTKKRRYCHPQALHT